MKLLHVAKRVLLQLQTVIQDLDDHQYTAKLSVLHGATIGQHLRHMLEFFDCLINATKSNGVVNYDARLRDLLLENNRVFAIEKINLLCDELNGYHADQELILHMTYELDQEVATEVKTNLNRELAYNIEHSIHHMALIKVGLTASIPDIVLPHDFGIAYSTIKYRENLQHTI